MLHASADRDATLHHFAADPVAGYVLRNFCARAASDGSLPILLTDAASGARALIAVRGAHAMACHRPGGEQAYDALFAAMYEAGLEEGQTPWPDTAAREAWESTGRRYLFLDTSPPQAHAAALRAGFITIPDNPGSPPAGIFALTGKPRFANQIAHSCRLGREQELLELLKRGISYDQEGEYVAACLREGPSFVCEDAGQAVSWSATHLNGSMGMIYTPPELRRQGYARSLAAFQVDHMLRIRGVALAHVIEGNTASQRLLMSMGAAHLDGEVCWRTVYWG